MSIRPSWVAVGTLALCIGIPEVACEPDPFAPDPAIAAAREKDQAAYDAAKAKLHAEDAGNWVVIAEGLLAGKGRTLDDVKAIRREATHRFVFRVGEEGDKSGDASSWYAPRFAGRSLLGALGVRMIDDPDGQITLQKGSAQVVFGQGEPFPVSHLRLASPDGEPEATRSGKPAEVFLGTVGPALLMAPEDAVRLHLERWEVPGTEAFFQGSIPCRRALLTVSVDGLPGDAVVIGCYPVVEHARLVDLERGRDRDVLARHPPEVPAGEWVLFGATRMLSHAATREDALALGVPQVEMAHHRFLLKCPEEVPSWMIRAGEAWPKPRSFDVTTFRASRTRLNDVEVDARSSGGNSPTFVVSAADASRLHLELAEAPWDAAYVDGNPPAAHPARGGYAWTDVSNPSGGPSKRVLALVLYQREQVPYLDDPNPSLPPGVTPPRDAMK
jgi:hypothetical protein